MKEIKLSQGKVALVDDEDFDSLSKYKWHYSKSGYAIRTVSYKPRISAYMHKIIVPFEGSVDHINGNRLDNRKQNLRRCSHKENCRNQKLRVDSASGFKGVCWITSKRKYRAYINDSGKQIFIGYFSSALEAAKAYNKKSQELFGEFARPNEI